MALNTKYDRLVTLWRQGLACLMEEIAGVHGTAPAALAIVAPVELHIVAGVYRLPAEVRPDDDLHQKYSPAEWTHGNDNCFEQINPLLTELFGGNLEYAERVQRIVESCLEAFRQAEVRRHYPDAFLTFAGLDPSDEQVRAEAFFVRTMNPQHVFEEWKEEFGLS